MKYTRYIAKMVRQYGTPQLEQEPFQTMMNIVCLENRISALQLIKKRNTGKDDFYKYDLDIRKWEAELKGLTHELEPDRLMIQLSKGKIPGKHKIDDPIGQPWSEFDVDLNLRKR